MLCCHPSPQKITFELIFADCKTQQTTMSYIVLFFFNQTCLHLKKVQPKLLIQSFLAKERKIGLTLGYVTIVIKIKCFLSFLILLSCSVLATLGFCIWGRQTFQVIYSLCVPPQVCVRLISCPVSAPIYHLRCV